MALDFLPSAIDLARFQFAFTIVWHFLFPAFTIGLASYLAVLEGRWLWTGNDVYLDLSATGCGFRDGLRHGRCLGHRDVVPVRHQWSVFADRTGRCSGRCSLTKC